MVIFLNYYNGNIITHSPNFIIVRCSSNKLHISNYSIYEIVDKIIFTNDSATKSTVLYFPYFNSFILPFREFVLLHFFIGFFKASWICYSMLLKCSEKKKRFLQKHYAVAPNTNKTCINSTKYSISIWEFSMEVWWLCCVFKCMNAWKIQPLTEV